jgi:hypothetical protein
MPEAPTREVESQPVVSLPTEELPIVGDQVLIKSEPLPAKSSVTNGSSESSFYLDELVSVASNLGKAPILLSFESVSDYKDAGENKQKIAEGISRSGSAESVESTLAALVAVDNAFIGDQDIVDFNNELKKLRSDIDESIEEKNNRKSDLFRYYGYGHHRHCCLGLTRRQLVSNPLFHVASVEGV